MNIDKPLPEGAYAVVGRTMQVLSASERHINHSIGALEQCAVPFDHAPFKQALRYLDQAHAAVSQIVLAHLNASVKPGSEVAR